MTAITGTPFLTSPRLQLFPLNGEQLAWLSESRLTLHQNLGLVEEDLELEEMFRNEIAEALNFWLNGVQEHPDGWPWYTNWEIVLAEEKRSIGGIGFTGLPDESGTVEFGYMIDARYRNRGYMREAIQAMLMWAFSHPDVMQVRAQTPPDNLPSQKVLLNNGFHLQEEKSEVKLYCLRRDQF